MIGNNKGDACWISWLHGLNVLCQSPGKDRHTEELCPVNLAPANTHTHSPTLLGERSHMLKGTNQDSGSVMSHQGSPVWKILPHQQHQKLPSIHVLPHKPLWDRHNGKWEGQPRKPLWRLTPTTVGERLHYSLSGSGILSSRLLNWVWLPGKVILPKANWHVHETPNSGWQ